MSTALDVLAEDGLERMNADRLAARARSGKAAIYRRWSSMPVLIAQAVHTCHLVPDVPDTGALRTDLVALLAPWTRRLSRCERAAASLLGHAGRDTQLDDVLEVGVVQPLAAAVILITTRQARREPALLDPQVHLLGIVVQSLWWQRYATNPHPSTPEEVALLVDRVLLPVALST